MSLSPADEYKCRCCTRLPCMHWGSIIYSKGKITTWVARPEEDTARDIQWNTVAQLVNVQRPTRCCWLAEQLREEMRRISHQTLLVAKAFPAAPSSVRSSLVKQNPHRLLLATHHSWGRSTTLLALQECSSCAPWPWVESLPSQSLAGCAIVCVTVMNSH